MEYVADVFARQKALSYLDINKFSKENIQKIEIDKYSRIYADVITYQFDESLVLKALGIKELAMLDDDSLKSGLNKYLSDILYKKLDFLKSVGVTREYTSTENIYLNKVNGHRIFKIGIDENSTIKKTNVLGMDIAYLRVFYDEKVISNRRVKNLSLREDQDAPNVVIIVKRDKRHRVKDIIDIFSMDYFMYFGDIVVGVSDYETVKFIDEI